MNELIDYQGLFNCLRPDPPMVSDCQDEIEEPTQCDYCKSYNGERPTIKFTVKDDLTGKIEIFDLCDDCQKEDHIFRNKNILRTFKL